MSTQVQGAWNIVVELLTAFKEQGSFTDYLRLAFGNEIEEDVVKTLIQDIIDGQNVPEVEILSAELVGGANAAYVASDNRIYLAQEYLDRNVDDVSAIASVLLEGLGHYIDNEINSDDATGDGGALSSPLVRGENLSASELNSSKKESGSNNVLTNGYKILDPSSVTDTAPVTPTINALSDSPASSGTFDLSSLNGTNGFTVVSEGIGTIFTYDVSNAGDINGDGIDDFIIGLPGAASNSNRSAGKSYAVFGHSNGFEASFDLSALDGSNGFVLNGIDSFDFSGSSVSSAGDVNGDGVDDLIIGAFGADPNSKDRAGESYVVFGNSNGFEASLDLSALDGRNGFVLNGIDSIDLLGFSGSSVSSAGDVNGDGLDDLIIGAYRGDPNDTLDAGESYVVFGNSNGFEASFDLSALDGSNGFVLNGIDSGDRSGISVSDAGDVNGDGIDDLIIGAYFSDPNSNLDAGESYVVLGNSSGFEASFDLSALDGSNGFVLNGIDLEDFSGFSVSGAGDVNGDGLDDLIIGAFGAADMSGIDRAGESYVVFGNSNDFEASLDLSTLDGSNGFVLNGIDGFDFSGFSVSGAGDVNGDGLGDLIIGAYNAGPTPSTGGESYVVFGNSNGFEASLDLSALDGRNGVVLSGIDGGDRSGFSVSGAGDVNDDGLDDLIIGAPNANLNGNRNPGESYVVFGNDRKPIIDLNGSGDGAAGFVLNGIDSGDASGISVSGAGDVNNDGIDDLIIGASGADPNGTRNAGESYVVFGNSNGFEANFDLSTLDGSNGFVLNGVDSRDASGFSVSDAGDVNGDGIDDLIVGAAFASVEDGSAESYVIFGTATGFEASLDLSNLGGSNGFALSDSFRFAAINLVSSAGDVNGDGIDDLIIGALVSVPNGNLSAGESYVVFGNSNGFEASFDLSALDGSNGFVLNGIDSGGNRPAISVSNAGDVNGDGIDDLIVGAEGADPSGNLDAGESYVVFGNSNGFEASFDLSTLDGSNGFVLNGIDIQDFSGISVSGAGDVNGDGIDDLIIGALGADPNGNRNAGESYVIFGNSNGFEASFDLSTLDGRNGFVLNGIDRFDGSGRPVSSAGDMNGDGIDDLIIGARFADPNGNLGAGESYVVFGSDTRFAASFNLSSLDGSNGFVLNGIDSEDFSGTVSGAGDVNGDGIDDIIIGATGADPNGNNRAGESYVILGDTSIGSSGSLNLADISGTGSSGLPGIDFTTVYDGNPTSIVSSNLDIDAGPSAFLQSATITLTNRPDGNSESLLADVTGTAIVASYDAATGILTLSGTDTVANYEQVLRTLQYSNSETTPDSTDRIIEVTITSDQAINNMSAVAVSTVAFDIPENNTIDGTPGDDIINGTPGDDIITGLVGNDTINGNAGNDLISGGASNDIINGDEGDDRVDGNAGDDTINGGEGDDQLNGGSGNDVLFGDEGDDKMIGSQGDDSLFGGEGDDRINGGNGRDILQGDSGNDWIYGKAGDDILMGVDPGAVTPGRGEEDALFGGLGADRFVLGDASRAFYLGNGDADFAEIRDFNLAENDLIQLSGISDGYSLQISGGNTLIFADDGTTTDLVGVVRNVSLPDFSSGFTFV